MDLGSSPDQGDHVEALPKSELRDRAVTLTDAIERFVGGVVRKELEEFLRNHLLPSLQKQTAPPAASPALDHDKYVSTERAAELAGVKPATVREWVRQGKLPSFRAGRLFRVRVGDLRGFMARSSVADGTVIDLEGRAIDILSRGRRAARRR